MSFSATKLDCQVPDHRHTATVQVSGVLQKIQEVDSYTYFIRNLHVRTGTQSDLSREFGQLSEFKRLRDMTVKSDTQLLFQIC